MLTIQDQNITILGAKRSGLALARLVTKLGGRARISEQGSEECLMQDPRAWALKENISVEFNGHTKEFIRKSDLIVLSPGVSVHSEIVQWAKSQGIPVLGEIEFAFQFCPIPVIAVTGSNGKTTVSTLIHKVITEAGYKSVLCGNVGFPFSDFVLDLEDKDFVVLEISSFQLESLLTPSEKEKLPIAGFKPHIAVFLNFSENHLDRHADIEEYFEAKKRIFQNQDKDDYAVLNKWIPRVKNLDVFVPSQVHYFGEENDKKADDPNRSAVCQVAEILEIDPKICQKVFDDFKGVEHRLEWVRNIAGVDFINDSKATTAEAGRWALEHIHKPIVMICGGKDKNIDFSVLEDIVKKKVKKMIVIGEAKEKIKKTFDHVVKVEECDLLEHAVEKARELAQKGDCVVLTPMCASFDMFTDFEERGRIYKQIVNGLK